MWYKNVQELWFLFRPVPINTLYQCFNKFRLVVLVLCSGKVLKVQFKKGQFLFFWMKKEVLFLSTAPHLNALYQCS